MARLPYGGSRCVTPIDSTAHRCHPRLGSSCISTDTASKLIAGVRRWLSDARCECKVQTAVLLAQGPFCVKISNAGQPRAGSVLHLWLAGVRKLSHLRKSRLKFSRPLGSGHLTLSPHRASDPHGGTNRPCPAASVRTFIDTRFGSALKSSDLAYWSGLPRKTATLVPLREHNVP